MEGGASKKCCAQGTGWSGPAGQMLALEVAERGLRCGQRDQVRVGMWDRD